MNSRYILTALATASMFAGGQAIAQGRGNGHGAGGVGVGLGGSAHGGLGVDLGRDRVTRDIGVRTRTDARLDSQGPAHANARARARASDRSVLARGRTTSDLSLLRTGLTVQNANGVTLGTVARINRASNGRIVNVLVRNRATGHSRTIPVSPRTLSINGNVVTTSMIGLH